MTNPFIKVTWRDSPENFTKEKLKRVKTYFQNKYNSTNVRIIPEGIVNKIDTKLKSLDTNQKITDTKQQKYLMKEKIKETNKNEKWESIKRINKKEKQ